MIIDFSEIKRIVNQLDHQDLNQFLPQPTAENMARYLCMQIDSCYRVDVEESEGAVASYENQ
jgi:6-pyruvoyltetrahydropterin/6-carboxytetrahydropterin synthase